jgi:SanA protein
MADAGGAATASATGVPGPHVWRRRASRWLAVAAVLGGVAIAAGNLYVIRDTREQMVADVAAAPARPVAIVLGNWVFPGGLVSSDLHQRLEVALELYRAQRVERIIVSGATRTAEDYDEPTTMRAWLVRRGVPAERITLDPGGHRTAATMADAAALGVRSALICTQAYHLPRALYLARHAGLAALGVVARSGRGSWWAALRNVVREGLARAETVVEVALRGVRAN